MAVTFNLTRKFLSFLIELKTCWSNLYVVFQDFDFSKCFKSVLKASEEWGRLQACIPKQMRKFEDSQKSKKTVASMIERKGDEKENKKKGE